MNGLRRILRDEPTMIGEAFRLTLLAVVLLGLDLSNEQVVGIVAAVSAIIAVVNRALVTPVAKQD